MEAKKVQNGNGVKGNRNFAKEDFTGRHKRSKVTKVEGDPRLTMIQLRLTHPNRGVLNKSLKLYKLEQEKSKWERDGWIINVSN